MSVNNHIIGELLQLALQRAAGAITGRLGRPVEVVGSASPLPGAQLKFDLVFPAQGRLTWYMSNDDATGFSDLLIGGSGDRTVTLTELHLDSLTSAMSDMLNAATAGVSEQLNQALSDGDLDLGMAEEITPIETNGVEQILALDISGYGQLTVVQHASADLAAFLGSSVKSSFAEEQQGSSTDQSNVVSLPGLGSSHDSNLGGTSRDPADLELLMNVPLPITVELGSTERTIRELIGFSVGSIIDLEKLAGDPLDIKVNDRVIARGEVVVIDEEFGIRITEIMSPEERLRELG